MRGQGEDRDDLRPHHPGHAAAESEHPAGGGNPGFGDGRDRNSGESDRTLGFQYVTHERCASAITRLVDIGIQPFLVASSVLAIMAQRLVRKVCPKCKVRYEPPAHILAGIGLPPEIAKKANFMRGKGCNHCNKRGYRGRMGIFELMSMTTQIREMTFKGESTQNIRKVARKQGMRTLFEDGMIKALKGVTTLDEVMRITQREMAEPAPAKK